MTTCVTLNPQLDGSDEALLALDREAVLFERLLNSVLNMVARLRVDTVPVVSVAIFFAFLYLRYGILHPEAPTLGITIWVSASR